MPIIERSELEEARETMRPVSYESDAETVRDACPKDGTRLVYVGLRSAGKWGSVGSYRAFAVCPRPACDYTEEF